MKTFDLTGEIRNDFGKKAAKTYRSKGLIPCVVYGGKGEDNIHFVVKKGDVRKLIYTAEVYIVNLNISGKSIKSVIQELQFHPVTDEVLHIDFLHIFEDKPVVMNIPVRLEGLAAGVKAGGKLTLDMRLLRVKALPANLPEEIVINVENLEYGKSIKVGDLKFDNFELLNGKDAVICRVRSARTAAVEETTRVEETAGASAATTEAEKKEESPTAAVPEKEK